MADGGPSEVRWLDDKLHGVKKSFNQSASPPSVGGLWTTGHFSGGPTECPAAVRRRPTKFCYQGRRSTDRLTSIVVPVQNYTPITMGWIQPLAQGERDGGSLKKGTPACPNNGSFTKKFLGRRQESAFFRIEGRQIVYRGHLPQVLPPGSALVIR